MTIESQSQSPDDTQGSVLSVDPGEHIGVALWTSTGILLWQHVWSFDELADFLDSYPVETVVMEDYIVDFRAARLKGNKNKASQVLGLVKGHARRTGTKIVIQKNTILRVAAMHSGIQIPAKGHIRDDISAVLHGYYYFESTGMRARDIQI